MAQIQRLEIYDFEVLGRLIKTWALGEDRVQNGGKYLPAPTTLKRFIRMLVASGATTQAAVDTWLASFGGTMVSFKMVQSTPQKLVVRLPMAQMVRDMEARLALGGSYPLPPFYSEDFFKDEPQIDRDLARQHNERIGDYTIAQCG